MFHSSSKTRSKLLLAGSALSAALWLTACLDSPTASNNGGGDNDTVFVPATYAFIDSNGVSSVDIAGQVERNLLINDIQSAARVAASSSYSGTGMTANDILKYYVHVDSDSLAIRSTVASPLTTLQTKYAQLASGKSLHDKISTANVIGYGVPADSLIRRWTAIIVANSLDSTKRKTAAVYLDSNGVDLSQMISKLQAGAVSYYQATAVYLQGVTSKNNTVLLSGKNYTDMEHAWDEAFGYFGASRDYVTNYTDEEMNVGTTSYKDVNADTKIDFRSEYNFAMMGRYTARRDRNIAGQDWNGEVFRAFTKGRALISNKRSADSILAQRTIIAGNTVNAGIWEKVFASNTISYIKQVKIILDTTTNWAPIGARTTLAGNWSEMKAFSLCLQFNPYKKITDTQLAQLQGWLGVGPVRDAGKTAYVAKLDSAFALVKSVYGFSDTQVNSDSWK